jgi:hypothetical protein
MYKVGSTVIGVSLIAWRETVCLRALSNSRIGVSYCSSNMLPWVLNPPPPTFFMRAVLLQWGGGELRAVEGVGFKFNRVNFRGEGRLYSLALVIIGGIWTLLLAHKLHHQLTGSGDIHRCCHSVCQIMCSNLITSVLLSPLLCFLSSDHESHILTVKRWLELPVYNAEYHDEVYFWAKF